MITYSSNSFFFGDAPTSFNITTATLTSEQVLAIRQFSHYRIKAVKFLAMPLYNTAGESVILTGGTVSSVPSYMPTMYSLYVNNRDEIYGSAEDIILNPRHKSHKFNSPINRYTKLKTQTTVGMGANSSVDILSRNRWISTTDTDAVYGRFFLCPQSETDVPTTNQSSVIYHVKTVYYLEMRNVNINNST